MSNSHKYRLYLMPTYTDVKGARHWILTKREGKAYLLGSTGVRNIRYTGRDAWILTGCWLNCSVVIGDPTVIQSGDETTDVFHYNAPSGVLHCAPNKENLLLLPQEGYVPGLKQYQFRDHKGALLELPIERTHTLYLPHRGG